METEASAITLFVFAFMALVPMVASYAVERGRMLLSITSSMGFLILGVYCYQNNTEEWSMLYGLFFFSMIMVAVNIFMAVIMREKAEYEPTMEEIDGTKADYVALQKDKEDFNPKPTRQRKAPQPSKNIKRALKPSASLTKRNRL